MDKTIKDSLTKDVILQAAKSYNVDVNLIKYLGGFENFVYEFVLDDTSYIMRFVHSSHRRYEDVLAELEFQDYLARNEVDVSYVVKSINNLICEKIDINNHQAFYVSVFNKAPGTYIQQEDLTEEFIEYFGEVVGKMHHLTKSFKPKYRRIHWYEDTLADDAKDLLKEEDQFVYSEYKKVVNQIRAMETHKDNYGLIHTDMHFGNMFYHNEKITIFDFDDAAYKHFISDIAIILFYRYVFREHDFSKSNEHAKTFLIPFLKGYRKFNSIDDDSLKQLNLFLKLRIIILFFALYLAGEENEDSMWGKLYLDKYRPILKEGTDILDLDYVLE